MLPLPTLLEVESYIAALRRCYASQGQVLVVFERYLAGRQPGGNHMHLNCVGVPLLPGLLSSQSSNDFSATETLIKSAFVTAAKRAGFDWEHELTGPNTTGQTGQKMLQEAVGKGEFVAMSVGEGDGAIKVCHKLPTSVMPVSLIAMSVQLVHAIPRGERHSMNFGREVLAGLIDNPSRANWQECKLDDKVAEEAKVAGFKTLFKPFDAAADP